MRVSQESANSQPIVFRIMYQTKGTPLNTRIGSKSVQIDIVYTHTSTQNLFMILIQHLSICLCMSKLLRSCLFQVRILEQFSFNNKMQCMICVSSRQNDCSYCPVASLNFRLTTPHRLEQIYKIRRLHTTTDRLSRHFKTFLKILSKSQVVIYAELAASP